MTDPHSVWCHTGNVITTIDACHCDRVKQLGGGYQFQETLNWFYFECRAASFWFQPGVEIIKKNRFKSDAQDLIQFSGIYTITEKPQTENITA